MREIKYKGVTAYITEADWRNLLRRLDPARAKKIKGRFVISVPSSLCKRFHRPIGRYEASCTKCPLRVFEAMGEVGCDRLEHGLIPEKIFIATTTEVFWAIEDDKEARYQLAKLRDIIKTLPRIERGGEDTHREREEA